jgi:hypothetical protein
MLHLFDFLFLKKRLPILPSKYKKASIASTLALGNFPRANYPIHHLKARQTTQLCNKNSNKKV